MLKPNISLCSSFLILATWLLSGCQKHELFTDKQSSAPKNERSEKCMKASPCPTSLYALISDPLKWDGKYVSTAGYYSVGRDRALFSDQFSADNSILRNGVLLNPTTAPPPDMQTDTVKYVSGKFNANRDFRDHLGQINPIDFSGELVDATIYRLSFEAWSCGHATPDVQERYMRRDDPCFSRERKIP